MDRLLDEGRQLKSDEERKKVYQDVQHLLLDDAPAAVVYVKNHSNAVSDGVQNFYSTPRIWLELKDVSVEK